MVVEAPRVDLDVVPLRVKTQRLLVLQVRPQCRVARRRVEAVGPEALVQRAELEDERAVEQRPRDSVDQSQCERADAKVPAEKTGFDRFGGVGMC